MAASKGNYYRGNWGPADIISAASVVLIKDEWKTIGQVVVPADQLIGLGYGGDATQDASPGRMYVDLQDATPAAVTGQFRIEIQSSNDMPLGGRPVLIDYDLATMRLGSTARSERLPMPFNDILLSKDKKFVFKVKNNAAAAQTLTLANCKAEIDITKQLV